MPPLSGLFWQVLKAREQADKSAFGGLGLGELARLGVVSGEAGGDRKTTGLGVVDTAPAIDPWRGLVVPLDIEGQGDDDVAAVGPLHAEPGVVFLQAFQEVGAPMVQLA